jgi:hypothetical protein
MYNPGSTTVFNTRLGLRFDLRREVSHIRPRVLPSGVKQDSDTEKTCQGQETFFENVYLFTCRRKTDVNVSRSKGLIMQRYINSATVHQLSVTV